MFGRLYPAMQLQLGNYSPFRLYLSGMGRDIRYSRGLYVNVGIGYVGLPFRFGAWREITVLTLRLQATPLSIDFLMHLHLDGDPFTHFLIHEKLLLFSFPCICNCSNAFIAVRKLSASKEPNLVNKEFYFRGCLADSEDSPSVPMPKISKRLSSGKRIYSPYFITHINQSPEAPKCRALCCNL